MLPQAQVKSKAKRKRRTRDNDREEEEEKVGHSDSAAPQVKRSLRKKAKIDYTIDDEADLGDEEVRLPQPVKRGTRKRGIDREGGEVKQATRGRGRRPSRKVSSDDGNNRDDRRSMSSSLSPPPSDTAK